jgi:hypothetical protein
LGFRARVTARVRARVRVRVKVKVRARVRAGVRVKKDWECKVRVVGSLLQSQEF